MRYLVKVSMSLTALCTLLFPSIALAAAGAAAPIVIVADTRKLDGLMFMWGSLYNESHLQFTLLTVVLIPLVGLIFGFIADIVMNWIGIDLKNRSVAEH